MKKKLTKSILGFLIAWVSITTVSVSGELLHGPDQGQADVTSNEVSIIVYRENSGDTRSVPVIFIEGRVVASLLPGEYTQRRVCSTQVKLRVATRGDIVTKGRSEKINITKGSVTYVKIVKTKDQGFAPIIVDEVQGKKALQNLHLKSNVINRYSPKVVLRTDSLFRFGSAELLPSSHTAMNKLVENIKMCADKIKQIKIIGHTDRLGSKKLNEKLSKDRAQKVADYLREHGVNLAMHVEGHGSREPVTTNCRGKRSPQLIECLKSDRRVVLEY